MSTPRTTESFVDLASLELAAAAAMAGSDPAAMVGLAALLREAGRDDQADVLLARAWRHPRPRRGNG